jgi:hypothetical protein
MALTGSQLIVTRLCCRHRSKHHSDHEPNKRCKDFSEFVVAADLGFGAAWQRNQALSVQGKSQLKKLRFLIDDTRGER